MSFPWLKVQILKTFIWIFLRLNYILTIKLSFSEKVTKICAILFMVLTFTYLVNVKSIRRMAEIFVAFSEKLNFNRTSSSCCTEKEVFDSHIRRINDKCWNWHHLRPLSVPHALLRTIHVLRQRKEQDGSYELELKFPKMSLDELKSFWAESSRARFFSSKLFFLDKNQLY